MSDLSELKLQSIDPQRLADLRVRAAARLTGAAATKGPLARAADALSVLHGLASAPQTASDALALLHELQVHQVELDLQAQELLDSRAELESALRRQTELYDFQPVGCFTVDSRAIVWELNLTGSNLLGVGRDDALGLDLASFFFADSQRRFRSLITRAQNGEPRAASLLSLKAEGQVLRSALASICADPAGDRFLVSLAIVPSVTQEPPGPR